MRGMLHFKVNHHKGKEETVAISAQSQLGESIASNNSAPAIDSLLVSFIKSF